MSSRSRGAFSPDRAWREGLGRELIMRKVPLTRQNVSCDRERSA